MQETNEDLQKAVQASQKELQDNPQIVAEVEKVVHEFQDVITRLEKHKVTESKRCGTCAARRHKHFMLCRNRSSHLYSFRRYVEQKNASAQHAEWFTRFMAEVGKEKVPGTGGRSTKSASGGANQAPQPVRPDELQGTHLDESMDDAFNLDPHRFPVLSPQTNIRG